MRILLTEGSGLTSRQVAGRLGALGHHVEILSSTPIALARFTRHVRAVHAVPRFGLDPFGWLEAAEHIAETRAIDLLLPTQEQAAVLSARERCLRVATIVPPFPSLARLQDKISAYRTLSEIGAPQPAATIVESLADLEGIANFPVFVKRPIGTASSGVLRACDRTELERAVRALGFADGALLVQAEANGPLAMILALADRGRLVAHHACLRLGEGVGGGASLKESVALPGLRDRLAAFVAALDWHGGLAFDAILADEPLIIDVNPRLVEPGNALAAGVDVVKALIEIAEGRKPAELPAGRAGVRTRQTLLAVLGAAQQTSSRGAILSEARAAITGSGPFAGSSEELTPLAGDPLAAVPVAAALAATLALPSLWRKFHAGAVGPYAVTSEAWRRIVAGAR